MSLNFVKDHARTLFENGYHPVPIKPGYKYPYGIKGWQKANGVPESTIEKWEQKYPNWGVGILTCNTPAIDIDVLDPDIVQELAEFTSVRIGSMSFSHRVGQKPKLLIPCRFAGEPFRKVQSAAYEDFMGDVHRVEILGIGQQFVAHAVHPGTGQPYTWHAAPTTVPDGWRGLVDTPHDALPEISYEDAVAIVEHFESLAQREGWQLKSRDDGFGAQDNRSTGVTVEGAESDEEAREALALINMKPKVDRTTEELAEMLKLIDASAHDRWVKIGMALWHQYDGNPEGFQLWDEWSRSADNYDPDVMEVRWDSFKADTLTRPVTCAYVIKLAKEAFGKAKYARLDHWQTQLDAVEKGDLQALYEGVAPGIAADTLLDDRLREALAQALRKTYKRVTGSLLPVGEARSLVTPSPIKKAAPGSDAALEQFPWCEHWVYVNNGDRLFNVETKELVTVKAFNARYNRELLGGHPLNEEADASVFRPLVLASDVALNFVEIPCVSNTMYLPGSDRLFDFEGLPCANQWDQPRIAAEADYRPKGAAGAATFSDEERQALTVIQRHFEVLVPRPDDREIVLDFLAHRVQNPADKCIWGLILQGVGGDGKTFVHRLMSEVLGVSNVRAINAFELEDKFTGWSEGAQMVFIEEIKLHGHNRYDVINRLKPLIANQVISVRRMQTDSYQAPNVVDYIAFTNFKDGVPVNDEATRRRFFYTFSSLQTKRQLDRFKEANPGYFDALYGALEVGAVIARWWLLNREISDRFAARGVAPPSRAMAEVMRMSKSDELCILEEWLDDRRSVCGDLPVWVALKDAVNHLVGRGCTVKAQYVGRLLVEAGYRNAGRHRLGPLVEGVDNRSSIYVHVDAEGLDDDRALAELIRMDIENSAEEEFA